MRLLRLLELEPRRVLYAIAAGVGALGSAVALAALSAWLITRAWQMPPVLDLSVAVVAVRALGISRGLLRYLERLATHDLALRGTTTARARMYERLARGDSATLLSLRRGDLLARTGADVDALGDLVIRAVVPTAVAAVVSTAAVAVVAVRSPGSAAVLAVALVLAGVLAPLAAAKATEAAEAAASQARTEFTAAVTTVLDHASELRVAGRLNDALALAHRAQSSGSQRADRAVRRAAFATAATPLAMAVAVLGALAFSITAMGTGSGFSGGTDPMSFAIVVLLPLAAFEAVAALPAAATARNRARAAAARIDALVGSECADALVGAERDRGRGTERESAAAVPVETTLVARGLQCRRPGSTVVTDPVDLTLAAGARVAVVGPSGSGKTTLAATLAGLVAPESGTVTLGGVAVANVDPQHLRRTVTFCAEDAHIFETSVLENLRVARGDLDAGTARQVLDDVGLGPWVAGLPDGIDTVLGGGARAVSGGQRRRLLLARALVSPAPVLILDEPTEHLDDESSRALLEQFLRPESPLLHRDRTVVVITHRPVPEGVETVTIGSRSTRKNTVAEPATSA